MGPTQIMFIAAASVTTPNHWKHINPACLYLYTEILIDFEHYADMDHIIQLVGSLSRRHPLAQINQIIRHSNIDNGLLSIIKKHFFDKEDQHTIFSSNVINILLKFRWAFNLHLHSQTSSCFSATTTDRKFH